MVLGIMVLGNPPWLLELGNILLPCGMHFVIPQVCCWSSILIVSWGYALIFRAITPIVFPPRTYDPFFQADFAATSLAAFLHSSQAHESLREWSSAAYASVECRTSANCRLTQDERRGAFSPFYSYLTVLAQYDEQTASHPSGSGSTFVTACRCHDHSPSRKP